jgi:hypothetical protein
MGEEELAQPFSSSFSVTSEMLSQLGFFIEQAWMKRKSRTFYEIEKEFDGDPWNRAKLINACRYMFLSERFSGVWEDCLKDGDCPIEAKSITRKFDRKELYLG